MIAGHFRKNHVSTGDLNRPRSPEVRKPLVCFLVLFAQRKKNKPVPFPGTSEVTQTSNQHTATAASHRNNLNLFKESFEVLQTSKQRTKITTSCNPIKSFCRSAASSGGYAAFFVACGNRSPPLAAIFSALRRCPCRDGTLLVLFAALGGYISVAAATFAACGGISRRLCRLYNLPFRQVKNGTFRVTKSPV